MRPSPYVILFAYNRPDHLLRTLQSLMACDGFKDTDLTVHCDDAVSAIQALAFGVLKS